MIVLKAAAPPIKVDRAFVYIEDDDAGDVARVLFKSAMSPKRKGFIVALTSSDGTVTNGTLTRFGALTLAFRILREYDKATNRVRFADSDDSSDGRVDSGLKKQSNPVGLRSV